MKKNLAFFGAFNPPTLAHLELARYALEKTGGSQVVFVPSKSVYIHDQQGKDFAFPDEPPLAMLRASAAVRPWMAVTDWELRRDRQPPTYETLCHLREEGLEASLLLGSDKLPELEQGWQHIPEIAREFGIVCLSRGSDDAARMLREDPFLRSLGPGIQALDTPEGMRYISSTRVRALIRGLPGTRAELAPLVAAEIMDDLEKHIPEGRNSL